MRPTHDIRAQLGPRPRCALIPFTQHSVIALTSWCIGVITLVTLALSFFNVSYPLHLHARAKMTLVFRLERWARLFSPVTQPCSDNMDFTYHTHPIERTRIIGRANLEGIRIMEPLVSGTYINIYIL
jgi:hypothetical protein